MIDYFKLIKDYHICLNHGKARSPEFAWQALVKHDFTNVDRATTPQMLDAFAATPEEAIDAVLSQLQNPPASHVR